MSTERAASPLRQVVDEIVTTLNKLADETDQPTPAAGVALPKADVDPLIRAYKRAEKRVATAKEALESAKAGLLDALAGADALVVAETGQQVVEHKSVTAMVLDTARLKQERPDVVAGYQKPRTQRPFRVLV